MDISDNQFEQNRKKKIECIEILTLIIYEKYFCKSIPTN